jgi:hypothetical protein
MMPGHLLLVTKRIDQPDVVLVFLSNVSNKKNRSKQ